MKQLLTQNTMWSPHDLKDKYDVVIIGAGIHGLSTAYYLAKRGITNVAVLDKGYVGGGASGRNTAIIRANYLTVEGIPFFRESLNLYEDLAQELDFNLLFDQSGRLDLGHSESAVYGLRMRTSVNKLLGVDSRMIGPSEIKELVPAIDLRIGKPLPVMGALYQSSAGVIRHDAVVWGYGRGADRMGVEIHPFTEVTGIVRENGRVVGVDVGERRLSAGIVMSATAGWSANIARMVDMKLPLITHPLQAFVTEPLKPFIDRSVSSANLHVYVYQTDRGEVVVGGGVDPYSSYSQRSTLHALEELAANMLELFPFLRGVNILRQWAGLCDMSPDYAPIMGEVDGLPGFLLSCGWGTWGFKAGPIGGYTMAELIDTGNTPDLIRAFNLRRFSQGKLVNERAAAPAAAVH
jgi:sarcosine oxidase subunit beta